VKEIKYSKYYERLFADAKNYDTIHLIGSYGSGKTYHACMFMLLKALKYPNRHILLCRKHKEFADRGIFGEMINVIEDYDLTDIVKITNRPSKIYCPNGSIIETMGLYENERELKFGKNESKKGIRRVTDAIIDEANEITELSYLTLDTRIRVRVGDINNNLIICMNPCYIDNWIPQRYYDKGNTEPAENSSFIINDEKGNTQILHIGTDWQANKFLTPEAVQKYRSLEFVSKEMYLSGYLNKWITKIEGSGFNVDMIEEIKYAQNLREGVIYCDPAYSDNAYSNDTAIIKIAYNYKENYIYISELDVLKTDSPLEIITKIKNKQDYIHRRIGIDGHAYQEYIWSNIMQAAGINIANTEYKKYDVDVLCKNAKVLVNLGKIKIKNGIWNSEAGKILKYQLNTFISKKAGDKDDAVDAFICAIAMLLEENKYILNRLIQK